LGSRPQRKYLLFRWSVVSYARFGDFVHSRIFFPQYIRIELCMNPVNTISRWAAFQ
jgi:hypothetical protein